MSKSRAGRSCYRLKAINDYISDEDEPHYLEVSSFVAVADVDAHHPFTSSSPSPSRTGCCILEYTYHTWAGGQFGGMEG